MHLFKAVAVLLAFAPTIHAEINFNQYVEDLSTNPQISQSSWTVTIDGTVTGLGSNGPNTKFYGYTAGYVETVCINGGNETPPGQNKEPVTLSGSVQGTTDSDSNGSYAYSLSMSEECSCGKEGATFEAVVGRGKDKSLATFTCGDNLNNEYLEGDGGLCCDGVREGDDVNCGGCECRVGDYLKDCPNSRRNQNYAQYAIGIQVESTIVDAVVRDGEGSIVAIKRQVCFASTPYSKVDGSDEIDPTDVTCWQCEICKDSNSANAISCNSDTYEDNYPALSDGCDDYDTTPLVPTGP